MKTLILLLLIAGGIYFYLQEKPSIKNGFEKFKADTYKEFEEFKSKN